MDLGLKDKAYVVSGGSAGLGFASAQALVEDGARVVVCSRNQEKVAAAVARLGGEAHARGVAIDLGDPGAAATLVATCQEAFGRIDGAVISVGGPPGGAVKDVDSAAWRTSFETVFLGPLRLAVAVLETGTEKAVTFVLSISVNEPVPGLGISNGLRPGLAGAAKSLADEYGPQGNRVNMVLPGRLSTDRIVEIESAAADPDAVRAHFTSLIPLGRYGRPEELGRVAAFLTSPAASYLTGIAVPVDGGMARGL